MAKFKVDGLDKLQKQLKKMEQGAKELERTSSIPLENVLTPSFMRKYTKFSTFDAFMEAGKFSAETTEEFENLPEGPFNAHVAENTKFKTWDAMFKEAMDQYIAKKLGF